MNILAKIIIAAFGWGLTAATTPHERTDVERIIKGTVIDIVDVPYHVALENELNYKYLCGGAIISESFVVTAAHCVLGSILPQRFSTLSPLLKTAIRSKTSSLEYGGTRISVKNITVHPKWNDLYPAYFDVAILELESKICFDERAQAITIADMAPLPGQVVETSGWGLTEFVELEYPKFKTCSCDPLQSVNMTIIDKSDLPTDVLANLTSHSLLTPTITVTVLEGSACLGDSGSPVTLNRDQLVGVMSWAYYCNSPNGFTNLAHPEVRDFIRKIAGV